MDSFRTVKVQFLLTTAFNKILDLNLFMAFRNLDIKTGQRMLKDSWPGPSLYLSGVTEEIP